MEEASWTNAPGMRTVMKRPEDTRRTVSLSQTGISDNVNRDEKGKITHTMQREVRVQPRE